MYQSIKKHEGLRLESYLDSVGVPTIGYGNTFYEDGSKVKMGDKITKERAEELFNFMLGVFKYNVTTSLRVGLNDRQMEAVVSFAYNVGLGNWRKSTLLKKINKNPNDPTIRDEFMKWNKAGGEVLKGLTIRRKDEADLYFS